MSKYPHATFRDIGWVNGRMYAYDLIILHVTAADVPSQFNWFSSTRLCSSHFHVAKSGVVEQYVDTVNGDAASFRGNRRSIGIETQGLARGSWTDAQINALARLMAWINREHGIPLVQVSSSRRGTRGVGYHALGVPATRAQAHAGVSQTGGELWSPDVGKVCPGPERIAQIPGLIRLAASMAATPSASSSPSGALVVDGRAGAATISRAQQLAGTYVDGYIDGQDHRNARYYTALYTVRWGIAGSPFIRALQDRLVRAGHKIAVDGHLGPNTIKALQAVLGVGVDGYCGPETVTAWQRRLNTGHLI